MAKKPALDTQPERERAFMVGVEIKGEQTFLNLEDSLDELSLLADTAGLDIVGQISQNRAHPHVKYFIGRGKVDEVQALINEMDANVVIFDDELSPRHQRELEKVFSENVRILDRTALILDIFAQHASTREGALQVELAQYEYRLPRLTRAWTHLARQAGGRGTSAGVGLRGPGETQLEVDRREIGRRIDQLRKEIEKIRAHRERHRSRRKQSRVPVVALVGYTNAGKSTLLNSISEAKVYVADQLFATLDPTTRRVELPSGNLVLFTDTVGFIQKLPTQLVVSFRATLEEIVEADLLLHMVDITHPNADAHAEVVLDTLKEIGADHIPVLTVFNKIDRLPNPDEVRESLLRDPDTVAISAKTGDGLFDLKIAVNQKLFESFEYLKVHLPFSEGGLLNIFYDQGHVENVEHTRDGIIVSGRLPGRLLAQYKKYLPTVEAE